MGRAQPSLVTPDWLESRLGDGGVRVFEVDAEWSDAYAAGHLPNAVGGEWKQVCWDARTREFPDAAEFARRMGALGVRNDTTIVVYGDPMPFGYYAWWAFRYCGHADVQILDGGSARWAAEGRPLVTAVPQFATVEYRPSKRVESMRVMRDDVRAAIDRPGCVLLDGRSDQEYRGERVNMPDKPDHGAERAGRIPGARHLDAHGLLRGDGTLLSAQELEALLDARGVSRDADVICYCRRAHRAAVTYFALSEVLGYPRVRVYDGSWTEWGSLVGVPIEQ
jgi:thiosulfate/3-mercaptopyruvate sulfurtransferase